MLHLYVPKLLIMQKKQVLKMKLIFGKKKTSFVQNSVGPLLILFLKLVTLKEVSNFPL